MPNHAPGLSGFTPSIAFAENSVNAASVLLDGDVIFDDFEGDFTGGSLTVSGLLAEDRIAVRDQGTGAGEIGVSGSDITYGSLVIGSFTGGAGATFTVTLNVSATSAAVEALIENLTYSNVSDTPVATRTLVLNVSDAGGADLLADGRPGFTELTGAANPFDGAVAGGSAAPAVVDFDGDGHMDLVVGDQNGNLYAYRNESGAFTPLVGAANPFDGVHAGSLSIPAFGDLDDDGDLDLLVGVQPGILVAYANEGGVFTQLAGDDNPFDGVDVGFWSAPSFTDVDGDGAADAVIGNFAGTLHYFHNDGGGAFTEVTGALNPFDGILAPHAISPAFVDLDGDGDLDLVAGVNISNALVAWRNDGNAFTELTGDANPFTNAGIFSPRPTFGDTDGDGDFDAVIGDLYGGLHMIENAGLTIAVNVAAQDEAPTLGGVAPSAAYVENDPALTLSAGLTVSDADDASMQGATVQITDGLTPGDSLGVSGAESGSLGGISWSYDSSSGTLTFTGDAPTGDYQALLRQVSFESASDDPGVGRVVTWTVQGDDGTGAAQTTDISVSAENDAPFIDLDYSDSPETGTTATYVEGATPVTIAPLAIVSDADVPANYDGYVVTVSFTANGTTDDQLEVLSTGLGPNAILVSGSDISYGGILVATFTGGVNGTPLVISFNEDACGCSLEAVTAAIGFSNVSDTPSTLDREITFTVDDGALSDSSASAIAIVSVIANDPPVLADIATSVTFAENLVNATPQLLDANVTFTDPDGNFDGATLTVTGLLLEDRIGVRNVGTDPGEISVSSGDISYGGTLIGTLCGCIGDSVTILFNADATAASIEAVIENLTYTNLSDAPTPSRILILNVTDSYGADLGIAAGAQSQFNALTGPANPFDPVTVYGLAAPVFVDLDGDGDLDFVVGDYFGDLRVAINDNGSFSPLADADNPFDVLDLDNAAKAAFIDIDGDSDLDLVVGGATGTLQLFENDLGVFTELTGSDNPFDSILVDEFAAPAFVNLDGDGDLDLVVGDGYGSLYAFRNDGGVFTELTGADNPFAAILVDYNAAPTFVDLDGDGDLDLVVGDSYGGLSAFQNDGGAFTALTGTANPFNAILAYGYASPAFADLDGDGDLDLVVGEALGTVASFAYGPPHGIAISVSVAPENDSPLLDLDASTFPDVDTTGSFTEGDPPLTIAPLAFFTDADQPANFGGYVMTLEFTQNGADADTLTIANIGPGASEIEVSGADVLYEGVVVGSFTGGAGGVPLVVTFNSLACACSVELTLANILFSNASQDPGALTRTVTFTLDDGAGGSASAEALIAVAVDEDPTIALPDAVSTDEATIATGSVFANNGAGADDDPDSPLVVTAVNGSGGNVGAALILATGALLTVNADGTFSYDPNGKFDATPAPGSGASNMPAHDSFTYAVNGVTTTVSLTINGLDTNDTLLGMGGNDSLSGGVGDDRYFVDQPGDLVLEIMGQGYDRVLASVDYVLAAGSEIEKLTTSDNFATTPIDLTGNELGQYLFGNAGANSLDGGGGADVMVGLGGDDRYYIDIAADRVIEASGEGYDRVLSAVSWTLQADSHVDKVTTIDNLATTAINLTGNNLSQYIFGNAGANTLDGGGGGDVMAGLEGDDRYIIRSSADRVIEAAGGGNDRVFAGASFVLQPGSSVEKITTIDNLGTAAIDLTGNELAQFLYGNEGANVLDGKLGNDILTGSGGADTFQFTTVTGTGNVDRIADFVSGVDKIALDDFIFVGLATGALDPNAFFVGSAAHDADDRIIYNQTTGALYFDYDGNGIGTAVQFATLDGHPILAATDVTVI